MNADDFRDYMLSYLFLRYLSDNYEQTAKKELGADILRWPLMTAARRWRCGMYRIRRTRWNLKTDAPQGAVIIPVYLWASIAEMARTYAAWRFAGYAARGFQIHRRRVF